MIDLSNVEKYRENNRIEAKKATGGLPHSIWETYSAFANAMGGVILLGVEEHKDTSLHPVDLPDPEKLVQEFWCLLRDPQVCSINLLTEKDVTVVSTGETDVIAIEVPPAPRHERPVYVGKDPFTGTYRRSGEGDIRCSRDEVRRMLWEQKSPPADLEIGKQIIHHLTYCVTATKEDLQAAIPGTALESVLQNLLHGEIIVETDGCYRLKR